MQTLSITLTGSEISLLASLLGGDTLLGIDDPFIGWLTEEIEEEWQLVKASLADRRFIELVSDEEVVMDVAVAALVGTCAFPEASFAVTYAEAGNEPSTQYLHVSDELVVEQLAVAAPAGSYRLTALEDRKSILEYTLELFGLDEQHAIAASKGELPRTAIARARDLAAGGEPGAVKAVLREAGLPESAASALGETLLDPIANGALVGLRQEETTWDVAGMGFLAGSNGMWRLRSFTRSEEEWVEVIPSDALEVRETIRGVVNRVLPSPVLAE